MNLARIDLPTLRLVVLCAESGTLSRAAVNAALSLSGASHKLKSLEDALGYPIFRRTHNGMTPTIEAQHTIALCRQIVSLAFELMEGGDPSWRRRQHVPPEERVSGLDRAQFVTMSARPLTPPAIAMKKPLAPPVRRAR